MIVRLGYRFGMVGSWWVGMRYEVWGQIREGRVELKQDGKGWRFRGDWKVMRLRSFEVLYIYLD
jgi:hypothetical protein